MGLRKPSLRFWLSMTICAFSFPLISQNKLVEKANEHYQMNQFSEAAALYEQALSELDSAKSKRNTTNIKTKLANCYRMNNKMEKAEVLYAEVVQDEKTKSDIYFFYGETLMGTGKYDEAKRWFLEYQKLEPEDAKGALMAESCDKAPLIQPYFQYIDIQEFMHNSPADDNGPVAFGGGMVFSSDRKQGFKLLKEKSGWTGRDYLDLYFSQKQTDGSYGEPEKFSSKLSEVNKNTGNASFTADGSEVFFTRNDNVVNKQKTYNLQIYSAQTTGEDRWKSVEKLPFCSPNFNFMHPAVSPDGQWLFFTTNKSGGQGGTDIWVSERKKDGGWENPENLGPAINTAVNEGFPFMDGQGRLYFCSKGHPGFGGFDIFFTEKGENGQWKSPVNLGKPLNSPLDDISIFISPDQKAGMFTSSRKGGDDDIFLFQVLDQPAPPPVQPIVALSEQAEVVEPQNEPEPTEHPLEESPAAQRAPEPATGHNEAAVVGTLLNEKEEPIEELIENQQVEQKKEEISIFEKKENTAATMASSIKEIEPIAENNGFLQADKSLVPLASFGDFNQNLIEGKLRPGDRFRLDGATYDPNIWQLTPRVSTRLNDLADYLKRFPSLEVELGFFTESLGDNQQNLKLSENRAATARDYLLKDGIPQNRISAVGYGETMPLNHCRDGVTCGMDEHFFNQRIEIKIVDVGERQ
jgi:outer membrane protein OmpA-like peptidoglycan-associated protein